MDEYLAPVVHQDIAEQDAGAGGFFGDLGGVDDDLGGALEEDVHAPPPEAGARKRGTVNATAAELEALELEPAALQEPATVPVAALFGNAAPAAAVGSPVPSQMVSPPPGLLPHAHMPPQPPGVHGPPLGHMPSAPSSSSMHPQGHQMYDHSPQQLAHPQSPAHTHQPFSSAPPHPNPHSSPQWPGPPPHTPPQSMPHASPLAARMMQAHPGPAWGHGSPSAHSPAAHLAPHSPGMPPHTNGTHAVPLQALFQQSPQSMDGAHAHASPLPPGLHNTHTAALPHSMPPPLSVATTADLLKHAPPAAGRMPLSGIASQHHYPLLPSQGGHLMPAPSTPGSEPSVLHHHPHPPPPNGPLPQRRGSFTGSHAGSHAGSHSSMRSSGSRPLMPVLPGLERWVRNYSCMSMQEVDEYLSFSMRNLHSGELYVDDYYYHAHLNKYYNAQNAAVFRPKELFALAPHECAASNAPVHARVEGLGKFVFSSLRAPRQLLAVSAARTHAAGQESAPLLQKPDGAATSQDNADAGGVQMESPKSQGQDVKENGDVATGAQGDDEDDDEDDDLVLARPGAEGNKQQGAALGRGDLQTSIQAGARRMIEDCNCYILDIDDIDRVNAAEAASGGAGKGLGMSGARPSGSGGGGTAAATKDAGAGSVRVYRDQRRCMLMDNVASTIGGRVFAHVIAHPKGRRTVAHILKRVFPPLIGPLVAQVGVPRALQGVPVIHLVLRHASTLFKGNLWPVPVPGVIIPDNVHRIEATVSIARYAGAAIVQINRPEDLLECLEAFCESDMVSVDPGLVARMEEDGTIDPEELQGNRFLMPLLLLHHSYKVDSAPWLGSILTALLERAAALQLATGSLVDSANGEAAGGTNGAGKRVAERFRVVFAAVLVRFNLHVLSLKIVKERMTGDIPQQTLLLPLLAQDVATAIVALCNPVQYSRLQMLLQQLAEGV